MRKTVTLCLLVVLAYLLVGCDTTTSGRNWPSGDFSVRRDGARWTPRYSWFYVTNGTLYLWAFDSDSPSSPYVEIVVPNAYAGNSYPLGKNAGSAAWAIYGPNQVPDDAYWTYAGSGTIRVDRLNGSQCAGSFDFSARYSTARNLVFMNGGSFDVGRGSRPNG